METIRCPRCQKLLRADARQCSRCGVAIATGKATRKRGVNNDVDLSQPTGPLASPHRAGHYSGLHSEDQPFQSSFFVRIQRPPQPEIDEEDASTLLDVRPAAAALPGYQAEPARAAEDEEGVEHSPAYSPLADFPTLPRRAPQTPIPEALLPDPPRRHSKGPRVFYWLVTGSLICFLLATGLLAFLLVGRNPSLAHIAQPRLLALPGEVRVGDELQLAGSGFDARHVVSLTRDTNQKLLDAQGQQILPTTDAQGAFQIRVPITPAWNIGVHALQASEGQIKTTASLTIQPSVAGPPRLQLGVSRIDLGGGNPGTISQKNMTLTNAGGGHVTWSARSNASWLALNPAGGSFVGNTVVVLTASRVNLAPQAYLGQIVFTQDQGNAQTLAVSMTVNTTSANLVLSTASLAFAGTPAQSPAGQTMVVQNSGGQALNWSASTTSDGGDWLHVTPASGLLAANTSAILNVTVATLNMALGTYHGALNFSYAGGPAQQVAVTLTVTPPPQPAMQLSKQSLSFTTNQGFNPPPQSFTVANPGNAPLNWAIHPDITGQAFLAITPSSGSVAPGQSVSVSVAPLLSSVNGTIKSTLTVIDTDNGTSVHNQEVNVSIAITNQPVITLITTGLNFNHGSSSNTDTATLLIFANSGSLPLNWSLSESSQVPWLSFDKTSGTLAAATSDYINVRCVSNQMQPGTYTVTLTIKDTDAGSVVASRTVTVTLVISA